MQVCDGSLDCPVGETSAGGEDENHCSFGSGDHPDTLAEIGEFSVLPLEEVEEGEYLLKTGFL